LTNVSTLSGFGAFDANGRAPFRDWCAYLTAISDPNYFDWSAVSGIAPLAQVQPLLDRVIELAPACPDIRQLVHADFGSNNVLVASGQVTAVIDWSEAMLGDPLYDVANIFFWRTWLACMEEQASFFELHQDRRGWNADRLLCYQLRIGLQSGHDAATGGDTDFVHWALDRCAALASLR
jgi:hygromycin-B 4-O-kinase